MYNLFVDKKYNPYIYTAVVLLITLVFFPDTWKEKFDLFTGRTYQRMFIEHASMLENPISIAIKILVVSSIFMTPFIILYHFLKKRSEKSIKVPQEQQTKRIKNKEALVSLFGVVVLAFLLLIFIGFARKIGSSIDVKDEYKVCESSYGNHKLSMPEAMIIIEKSECVKYGKVSSESFCNENNATWWIYLDEYREVEHCNPACVVNLRNNMAHFDPGCDSGYSY